MISEWEIILRLVVAAVLGAMVGWERERTGQPAGLRTHVILVVGSALAMTLSINIAMQFRGEVPNGDPARLAAQVISGIGFLGAGAILRYGTSVKGLTTAASLWTMAIIGMTVGIGYYLTAGGTTLLLLIVLVVLNMAEHRFINPYTTITVTISAKERKNIINDIREVLSRKGRKIDSMSIQKQLSNESLELTLVAHAHKGSDYEQLISDLSELKGVQVFKID